MKAISEMGLTYDQAVEYVRQWRCSCGGSLGLAWGGTWKIEEYVVRCGIDTEHNDFIMPVEYNPYTDSNMPGWKLSRRRRRELEQKLGPEKTKELMQYQSVAVLAEKEVRKILTDMWPAAEGASPREYLKALTLCRQYGLNPYANHIYLIPYNTYIKETREYKKVYVCVKGIDADRVVAQRHHHYSFVQTDPHNPATRTPRYMTEEEEKAVWGVVDKDKVRRIVLLRDMDTGAEAPGYGQWPKYKMVDGKKLPNEPKGATEKDSDKNSMENMGDIRAERQGLHRLYSADLPPSSVPTEDEFREKTHKRDKSTGEIIEGEAIELEEEPPITDLDETGVSQSVEKPGEAAAKQPAGPQTTKAEAVSSTTDAKAKNRAESAPGATDQPESLIDLEWLAEKLKELQAKGLKNWSNKAFMDRLNAVLGTDYKLWSMAARKLNREQAEALVKEIEATVSMS